MSGNVWTSPPNWPPPPAGWTPPPDWTPPAEWPPPPVGWRWWQPSVPTRGPAATFHLAGVGLLAVVVVGLYVLLLFLLVATSTCADAAGRGYPAGLLVGVVVLSAALVCVPAMWARRAYRSGHLWWPWLFVAAGCVIVGAEVVSSVHVAGCIFTF